MSLLHRLAERLRRVADKLDATAVVLARVDDPTPCARCGHSRTQHPPGAYCGDHHDRWCVVADCGCVRFQT